MSEEANSISDQDEPSGWEWAIVEIFGHRRHAGRTREEERFGAKMLRVDVPIVASVEQEDLSRKLVAEGWTTHYYGGSAIFSFSLTDEASVLRANRPYEPPSRLTYRADDIDATGDGEDGEEPF